MVLRKLLQTEYIITAQGTALSSAADVTTQPRFMRGIGIDISPKHASQGQNRSTSTRAQLTAD
jgi:hypothetical protein